jgi:dTDP-4-amino-4,6-dideoxygalactose transaminase
MVADFERAFAAYLGANHAVATSSGTSALHLALLAHGIRPGDEVITTPFTFAATANAILHVGARPVFADIDPATLNLSPDSVRARVTARTRALLPVHLYGNPSDMDALEAIAAEYGLALIQDACQAHGAELHGERIGSRGTACFSFYPTKNITSGEGGMLTTASAEAAERARLLRSHGAKTEAPYRHEVLGFNFRMTDVHAAIGLSQLPHLDAFNATRASNARFYDCAIRGVRRPTTYPDARPAWHQYTLLVHPAQRDELAAALGTRGIGVGIYYPTPIYRQPLYQRLGVFAHCPAADAAAAQVVSIPVHPGVSELERSFIADEVNHALGTH